MEFDGRSIKDGKQLTSCDSITHGNSSSNEFGVNGLGVVKAIVFGMAPL